MRTRRWSVALFLALAGLLGSSGGHGQTGPTLTGQELLCEFMALRQTRNRPGIYTVHPTTGQLQCVVPDGHRPVWAPDRSKFAFWYQGAPWIYDVARRQAFALRDRYRVPWQFRMEPLNWTPDSSGLIFHQVVVDAIEPHCLDLTAAPTDPAAAFPWPLWTHPDIEHAGAVSFAPDGAQAAYESQRQLPGIGPITSEIRIADVAVRPDTKATQYTTLTGEALVGKFCLNPRWQPHGTRVAFEAAALETGHREAFLWDTATQRLTLLSLNGRMLNGKPLEPCYGNPCDNLRVFGWSPKGDTLLVLAEDREGMIMLCGTFWLVPLDPAAEVVALSGTGKGTVYGADWSPDGALVAAIRGDAPSVLPLQDTELAIWRTDNHPRLGRVTTVVRNPEGLCPIALDW